MKKIEELVKPQTGQTKKSKLANKVVIISFVIILLSLGLFGRWATQSENVLEIKNSPFPVRTIREHPTAGGVIFMDAEYCKNAEVTGTLRMSYVSQSREVFLPISEEKLPEGCAKSEVPIVIPKDIIPDTYKIKFRVTYDLNPLKKDIVIDFYSQEVVIVDASDPTAGIVIDQPKD